MSNAALKEVPKEHPQLMPHRGNLANHERNVYRWYPEPGHRRAQVESAEYWAHVADKMRPGDKIEVWCEDGSYYAEMLVLASGKGFVKTHTLFWHDVGGAVAAKDGQFDIAWKGPVKKFCVIRVSDGSFLQEGFQLRPDAQKWLDENHATLTG